MYRKGVHTDDEKLTIKFNLLNRKEKCRCSACRECTICEYLTNN